MPVPEIWSAMQYITAIPLSHGSKVLMMTIPECEAKSEKLDRKRSELNRLIEEDLRDDVYVRFFPFFVWWRSSGQAR
jgi:hypothetical protein